MELYPVSVALELKVDHNCCIVAAVPDDLSGCRGIENVGWQLVVELD